MNWKNNVIENIIYIAFIGIMMIVNTAVIMNRFEPMIDSAIKQETTSIKNEFRTEIKKLKAKNGGTVDFDIVPDIDNKAQTNITKDSIPEKRGFFERIFGKKDK